ncbi:MAG: hypothetical protein EXS01_03900 [Phycisphaerales bacterium]|nr:hypothetical protein [Phycisphaerales bacterium]
MNTLILLLLLGCQGAPVAQPEPTTDPPMVPPSCAPAVAADSVDATLDGMEVVGGTMKDFTASATMEKFEAITGEREIRRGRVVVVGPSGADRQIAIAFDEFIDGTGRGSTDTRRFICAAGWMTEFDIERKQAIRRQVARAGEAFDPLRIGAGPFPVPLGQPKADVLREFTVSCAPIPDAPFFRSLQASAPGASSAEGPRVALRLVPRAGTAMARDTAAIVMVLDRSSFAPQAVEVEAVNGDRTRVLLRNGKLNGGLDEAARALLTPPATEGWKVDVRPME